MISGMIRKDSFEGTLRDLANKRTSGVMKLFYGDQIALIGFHKGRIVWAVDKESTPTQWFAEQLFQAGLIAEVYREPQTFQQIFEQLQDGSVEQDFLSWEEFKELHRQCVYRVLCTIPWHHPIQFDIDISHPARGDDSFFEISVQGFLLDLVDLESTSQDLESRYPADLCLHATEAEISESALVAHSLLLKLIGSQVRVDQLLKLSGAHPFVLRRYLAELESKGWIHAEESSEEQERIDSSAQEDFESVIDALKFLQSSVEKNVISAVQETEDSDSLFGTPSAKKEQHKKEDTQALTSSDLKKKDDIKSHASSTASSHEEQVRFRDKVLYSEHLISLHLFLFFLLISAGALFLWEAPIHLFLSTP